MRKTLITTFPNESKKMAISMSVFLYNNLTTLFKYYLVLVTITVYLPKNRSCCQDL